MIHFILVMSQNITQLYSIIRYIVIMIVLLNIVGLTINFIGALMMFYANTNVDVSIGLLPNGKDLKRMAKNRSKTRLFRFGMLVLSIGFFFQIIALILSSTI